MNKYIIFIILASFIWGTSFPAIAIGLKYTSPELLLFLRFLIATVISFIVFPGTITRLKDKNLVVIGVFNGFAYLLQFIGQKSVPAGQSSILVNFYSVLVPIISLFILHEKPSKTIIGTVVIGFTGVVFLTGYSNSISTSYQNYLFGVIIIFFSGVSWAFYVVFTKKFQLEKDKENKLTQKYSVQELFTASMFYTALIAFISLLFIKNPVSEIKIESIIVSSYLAIFATVIAFLLYLVGLEKLSATKVSIILLLEVVIAYILSILFLGEIITVLQSIGSVFIVLSIVLVVKMTNKDELTN